MRNVTYAMVLLGAVFLPASLQAAETCTEVVEKRCEIRKHPECGPVSLEYSQTGDGKERCDRVSLLLTKEQVIPMLRRVRCVLIGDDTRVRFKSFNYETRQGPRDGDLIAVRHGTADMILSGAYESTNRESKVYFENIGPGRVIMLKCMAFGPA